MQPRKFLAQYLANILEELGLPWPEKIVIEEPRDAAFGDLSTNAAMLLAKMAGKKPADLASVIAGRLLENCPQIHKAEVAGPGFCNVTFRPDYWRKVVQEAETAGGAFGHSESGEGRKVLVEYVSANPTGPLHVGHGRGAAVGDSVARLLRAAGYEVSTEYYLNDAGRQMRILGQSIWLRVLQENGQKVDFPEDCYKGDYIIDLARALLADEPQLPALPEDEGIERCREYGMREILEDIKKDLAEFRCEHQRFFSENSLVQGGGVASALEALEQGGRSYMEDGALWFESMSLGDDRNRVLRKSDGSLTYFATDIAYHHDKFVRGFDWLVDVWGADHHGYIPRMRAAIMNMGQSPEAFSVLLIQLVSLLRDGKTVSMSTRAGEFVTLAEVIKEVGVDAARFLFLSRSADSPLDFDLELAKRRSLDNPVYYVQYAHARICALMRKAMERGLSLPDVTPDAALRQLELPEELAILRQIAAYEETVANAARNLAPYHISHYLMSLATVLHGYYAKYQIIDPEKPELSLGRLGLLRAAGQTLRNGLFLLGVSAPDTM